MERLVRGERCVHIHDAMAEEAYRRGDPTRRAVVDLGGGRTAVSIGLRKDDALLGAITVYRSEVKPFSATEIALIENFAAQAVIAMENARLITETREALEQQTATAEVLQVINSSPGDLAPVFEAILEKAHTLCGVVHGSLQLYDGEQFRAVATHAFSEPMTDWLRQGYRPGPNMPHRRLVDGEPFVHILDLAEIDDPAARSAVELGSTRTLLYVALRKDNAFLGLIASARREVRPFSEKEIALLQNFAAQAVIAMENARLITETREALDQQTATAEVLQVINSSPGDLAPVFDAILEKAHSLCGVARGSLELYDGETFRAVATQGLAESFADELRRGYPASDNPATRPLIEGQPFTHILDIAEHEFPFTRSPADLTGSRTLLCVPLRRDDRLVGMIASARQEVRPFTDKQIALLQNFAAQAVIAMENARMITETREALEQQTAIAEVLGVINSSPGELTPVFDAMLEKAIYLCQASFGTLWTYDGEGIHAAAVRDAPREYSEFVKQRRFPINAVVQRLLHGEQAVQIADLTATVGYGLGDPLARELVQRARNRTLLAVALRKEDKFLGMFAVYRREVRSFSDKQIALLQNFAAQAVIAMENARLITETREALEQQTATAEVLQVINSSPGDLAPVFDAMLEKATRLCEAAHGNLWTYDGERFHPVATHGSPRFAEWLRERGAVQPAPGSVFERLLRGEGFVQIADAANDNPYLTSSWSREVVEITGARAVLVVPLRKDNALLGAIFAYRQEARPFTDKQIALFQNFAAQAVIAMENARLITETREALQQQTATAEVLQVINSSPGDLVPVFDAMLDRVTRLCDAAAGTFWVFDGEQIRAAAIRGMPESFMEVARSYGPGPQTPVRRIAGGEQLVHIADLSTEAVYESGDLLVVAAVDQAGIRTFLSVPLRKENTLLGVFSVYRREVRPFSDKQIALVRSFAAQAVIAM
jgi:GAF domain-containing protein